MLGTTNGLTRPAARQEPAPFDNNNNPSAMIDDLGVRCARAPAPAIDGGGPPLASDRTTGAGSAAAAPAELLALIQSAEQARSRAAFRRAFHEAQMAAHRCRLASDVAHEVQALVIACNAASVLGRNEEAVEAGLLAVRMAQQLPPGPMHALAYNYLGVAYLWSRSAIQAHVCLETSGELARRHGPPGSELHPALNAVFLETLALVDQRDAGIASPALDQMQPHLDRLLAIVAGGSARMMVDSMAAWQACAADLARAKVLALSGRGAEASALLTPLHPRLARLGGPGWFACFLDWTQAEIALCDARHDDAQQHLERMVENSLAAEYEQLVCLAYRLMSQLAVRRNDHRQALLHLQRMYQREWTLRAEAIASRETIVGWQLELRDSYEARRQLQDKAQRLERMSMEDHLTGLANRRQVELRLAELLSDGPGPAKLALAFIDIDDFKRVNDRHSHRTGDQVLQALAGLLQRSVRQGDLVGRLSGDEFVVVLPRADEARASEVLHRMQAAVAAHDWTALAEGLQLSVSAGVAQARDGDSVESLLHRGDTSMYSRKLGRARSRRA